MNECIDHDELFMRDLTAYSMLLAFLREWREEVVEEDAEPRDFVFLKVEDCWELWMRTDGGCVPADVMYVPNEGWDWL